MCKSRAYNIFLKRFEKGVLVNMGKIINILEFGAVANTDELQTDKIQKAIDVCFANGGGTVEIPKGKYLTGDIRIRSNVTLYLRSGAEIIGSRNAEDYFNHINDSIEPLEKEQITDAPYVHLSTIKGETQYEENKTEYRFKRFPASRWNNALIRGIDAKNIRIIGEEGAVIDGNNCFDEQGEEGYRGPHGITLFNCSGVELSGYTIQNTGNWAHNLLFCDNIKVDGISVLAGHDGFDAAVCNNLIITNSKFYTGDDCIAGFGNVNVFVKGCILNSSCSAIRFGGSNVMIDDCKMFGPGKYSFRGAMSMEDKRNSEPSPTEGGRRNMLSVFTYYADFSLPINERPGNILVSNCEIDTADKLLHYNYSGNETWQKNRPLDSIEFRNINANGLSMPSIAYGDEENKVEIVFSDVSIEFSEGAENIDFMHTCNFKNISFNNVSAKNFCGGAVIKKWSDGEISFCDCDFDRCKNKIEKANEEFFSRAI